MKLIHTLSLLSTAIAQQLPIRLESLQQPDLDLSSFNNNQFGILGDFDTASRYTYVGASEFTNQAANGNNNNSLIYTNGNNEYYKVGEIQNGSVQKIIPLRDNQFLIIGDFQSIGEFESTGTFIYDVSNGSAQNLNISGVNTAYFDDEEDLIYLGGDFTFNGTQSAAIYNLKDAELISTPFNGFGSNSHINSIVGAGSSIIFGGQFDTLGYPELLSKEYNRSSIEVEAGQLVSLRYANFDSSDPSSNPGAVACPESGEQWLVSGSAATLNIFLPLIAIPSKIRIYNSNDRDSQVSLFRLITGPSNSIMNLTYVDPSTGELLVCDAWCPLYSSSELSQLSEDADSLSVNYQNGTLGFSSTYQEFAFVNYLEISTVVFQALESYGQNIGLAGFQIYQSIYSTYANNQLNEPSCDSVGNYSSSELVGSWDVSERGYLTSLVNPGASAGVTFYPNITYAGQYSILLYTPGCGSDNTCSQRSAVEVSVISEESNEVISTNLIYQTNVELKYDSIFNGNLSGAIRVEMNVAQNIEMNVAQNIASSQVVQVVADRIGVTVISIDDLVEKDGTVDINGIFEYSPSNFTRLNINNFTESVIVGNSTINTLGGDLSANADVFLALYDEAIIVAGDFASEEYGDNFIRVLVNQDDSVEGSIDANVDSIDGGLNGVVTSLNVVSSGVVVTGNFTNTNNETNINTLGDSSNSEFNNVALFNESWYSLPSDISGGSSFAQITINGTQFWVFDGTDKFQVSSNSIFNDNLLLSFNSTAAGSLDSDTLFAGSLSQADALVNKGFLTDGSEFSNITQDTLEQSLITSGLFINESLSVFGGNFTTASGLSNLIIVENNTNSGLDREWSEESLVTKLFNSKDKLFIGLGVKGQSEAEAVLIYDLNNSSLSEVQPESLRSNTSSILVNEFGIFNNTYLIVGGEFTGASNINCVGLCFYNLNESSWESLIDSFTGSVSAFRFINNTIVISGDLNYDGTEYSLLSYDFNSTEQAEQPESFTSINQSVNRFILVDNSTSGRIIVSNQNSISAYDGSEWSNLTSFETGSTITDISLLEISDSNDDNDGTYFDSNQLLLASGELTLSNYGYSSVAYYNGTHWIPYLITTQSTGSSPLSSIFQNKDISYLFSSGSVSSQTPSQSSGTQTPTSSGSSDRNTEPSGKMDRGLIVLVSLAVAVGTVSLLGSAAAFLLYKKRKHDYTPLEPRVNETEMLDTVPPETLLKHI